MKKKIVIKFSKGGISDNLIQDTERRQTKHQQLQLRKRKYERDRPHKKPGVNRVKAVTVSYEIKSYVLVYSILKDILSNFILFQ
jgi:D-aminopeptidase